MLQMKDHATIFFGATDSTSTVSKHSAHVIIWLFNMHVNKR
jgi:hypothetical protein